MGAKLDARVQCSWQLAEPQRPQIGQFVADLPIVEGWRPTVAIAIQNSSVFPVPLCFKRIHGDTCDVHTAPLDSNCRCFAIATDISSVQRVGEDGTPAEVIREHTDQPEHSTEKKHSI